MSGSLRARLRRGPYIVVRAAALVLVLWAVLPRTTFALSPAQMCAAIGHCGVSPSQAEATEAILAKYTQFATVLGRKLVSVPEAEADRGFVLRTEFGAVYWSPTIGTFEVHGAIYVKYLQWASAAGQLGYPITDELVAPDTRGRFSYFENGAIYWHPDATIGAHTILGPIVWKWGQHGFELGGLGYPITDSTLVGDGRGIYNVFQGGVIYSTPETGASEVHGAILDRWTAVGRASGALGYPLTDELVVAGTGRYNLFEHGAIYWSPSTGAIQIGEAAFAKLIQKYPWILSYTATRP